MNRVELAVRTFFWIFFKKEFRDQIATYFEEGPPQIEEQPAPQPVIEEKKVSRSEAVQLLALLQREGRLVDFLQEPIDAYSDAQIGAAVRDVHRDCASVLDRAFGLESVVEQEEGSQMTVLAGFDPDQYRLTGNVTGNPPYNGVLRHHGWRATRCELPQYQGTEEGANVVSPAEVELS